MGIKKLTFEYIKSKFNEAGYELLSKEYNGKDSKMTCIDSGGYLYFTNYSTIRSNRKPKRYQATNPYVMYNIKKWIKENLPQYEILEDEYVNNSTKMKCYCHVHKEVFYKEWVELYGFSGCRKCGIERRSGERCNLWNGGKVTFNCDICGKECSTNKAHYERNKYHYCSKKCANIGFGEFFSGEKSCMWNDEADENIRIKKRAYKEYFDFVKSVFDRDDYTCKSCNKKGGQLNAHHLNGYNWDSENRTNVDNGVTLCEEYHKNFYGQYGYGYNTKEQFEEWMKLRGNNSE